MRELNIEEWNRKPQYDFYSTFEEPYFGVTVELDCTVAYQKCKKEGLSFFVYYIYNALKAVNAIENFRYRIVDEKVIVYDVIHGGSTILREDETFGFSHFPYDENFEVFNASTQAEINRVKSSRDLFPSYLGDNTIHFTTTPWFSFTGLSHARKYSFQDSVPKISFGKMTKDKDGKLSMSMAVHGHHGLMDGIHVGKFIEKYQELLNEI